MSQVWVETIKVTNALCGCNFSVEHAFSCPSGALSSIRHDDIRDLTARLLTEVCPNVAVEPELQPLMGETLSYRTSNYEDGARLVSQHKGFGVTGTVTEPSLMCVCSTLLRPAIAGLLLL